MTNPLAFSISHSHKTLSFSLNILFRLPTFFTSFLGLPIFNLPSTKTFICSIEWKLPLAEHCNGFQILQENSYWKGTSLTIPSYSRNTSWLCRVFVQHFLELTIISTGRAWTWGTSGGKDTVVGPDLIDQCLGTV